MTKNQTKTPQDRQLELLSNHFNIDKENKIIDFALKYDSVDDILNTVSGDLKYPLFKDEIISSIAEGVTSVPMAYGVNIDFSISDYKEYKAETIMQSFNDSLEIVHYYANNENKKSWLKSFSFIFTGFVILITMSFLQMSNILGSELGPTVIVALLDNAGAVFFWEGLTILLLEQSEIKMASLSLKIRIRNVVFRDRKSGEILVKENNAETYEQWVEDSKTRKTGRVMVLLAAVAVMSFIVYAIFNFALDGMRGKFSTESGDVVAWMTVSLFFPLFFALIASICSISQFRGVGPFLKRPLLWHILSILVCLYGIAHNIYYHEYITMTSLVLIFMALLVALLGHLLSRSYKVFAKFSIFNSRKK